MTASYRTFFDNVLKVQLIDNKDYTTYNRYDFIKGLWISNIAVYNNSIVLNSNHFMQSYQEFQEHGIVKTQVHLRKPHYIYTRIEKVYEKILNDININNFIEINEKCVFLHNSFSSGNAGHDLLYILDTLTKYIDYEYIKFVIFDEIEENTNNMQLIKLLVHSDRLIKIKKDTTYKFNNQLFNYEKGIYCMTHYMNMINKVKLLLFDKVKEKYSTDELESFKNKKVILIKNSRMKYIVRTEDMFNAEELYECIDNNKDYYIANPETDEYYKFTYILLNASVIISGQNGLSCANQIYYNDNAEVIGFTVGEKRLTINSSHIKYDQLCNSLYYNKLNRCIYCPLKIEKEDFEILKRII